MNTSLGFEEVFYCELVFENKLVSSVISETSVGSVGLDVARLLSMHRQSVACSHNFIEIKSFPQFRPKMT